MSEHTAGGAPRHRTGAPRAVQACLAGFLALFCTYVAFYLALRQVDAPLAAGMLRLFGLTIAAGRETALFDAQYHGMPLPWLLVFSYLDDLGTFLMFVSLFWFMLDALHRRPAARRFMARLEKQALAHRAWIQRWGLFGLAVFYFLPGFGSGVAVAAAMGVLARIPLGRLVGVLGFCVVLVDTLWALLLWGPAHTVPKGGWLDWLPLGVIAVVLTFAARRMWKDRANRHVALLDLDPHAGPEHERQLAAWGVRLRDGLVEADLNAVALATGCGPKRALWAAELLLLARMTPAKAIVLLDAGLTGVRDVARSTPSTMAGLLGDDAEALAQAATWHGQACAMMALAGEAWSRR